MPAVQRRRVFQKRFGLLLVAAILVFLVALGSNRPSTSDILVRRSLDEGLALSLMAVVLAGCCFLAFGVLVYMLLGTMRGPWRTPKRPAGFPLPWWAKVIVVVLALACIGGVVVAVYYARGVAAPPMEPSLSPALPGDGAPAAGGAAPVVVQWWVLAVVALVVLAAVAVFFFARRRRREPWPDEAPFDRRELRGAVDASLQDLDETHDCRRAVIRAYATMERVLAGHGLARHTSEAPFEYLARWTSALRLGRSTAEGLTSLYEWARFSPHSVDEDMRREATEALRALRHELEGDTA